MLRGIVLGRCSALIYLFRSRPASRFDSEGRRGLHYSVRSPAEAAMCLEQLRCKAQSHTALMVARLDEQIRIAPACFCLFHSWSVVQVMAPKRAETCI